VVSVRRAQLSCKSGRSKISSRGVGKIAFRMNVQRTALSIGRICRDLPGFALTEISRQFRIDTRTVHRRVEKAGDRQKGIAKAFGGQAAAVEMPVQPIAGIDLRTARSLSARRPAIGSLAIGGGGQNQAVGAF